jgi:hypothetical protein
MPLGLFAAEPSTGMKLQQTELSPQGDIVVEHYFNGENYQREIWLAPVRRPSDRVLLYAHGRSADVLFSPNQQWLMISRGVRAASLISLGGRKASTTGRSKTPKSQRRYGGSSELSTR